MIVGESASGGRCSSSVPHAASDANQTIVSERAVGIVTGSSTFVPYAERESPEDLFWLIRADRLPERGSSRHEAPGVARRGVPSA